jgi:hypothetical protein
MNDHSAERHVFTTLKTRPPVETKAVPSKFLPCLAIVYALPHDIIR